MAKRTVWTWDVVMGFGCMGLAFSMLLAMFLYAVAHDCKPNPPLRSHVFGKDVPIEAICKAWRQ